MMRDVAVHRMSRPIISRLMVGAIPAIIAFMLMNSGMKPLRTLVRVAQPPCLPIHSFSIVCSFVCSLIPFSAISRIIGSFVSFNTVCDISIAP